ncbi:MAG: hypothetical protein ACFFDT_31530 [Candidatus Hodarchaeota archaeon]
MKEKDIVKYRVILKKEDPSTDITDVKGVLSFQKNNIIFTPHDLDPNFERTYVVNELTNATLITAREWFKKKEMVSLRFTKRQVSVSVFFEPIDVSPEFFLQEILKIQEHIAKGTFSGVVGSLIEKIGEESQKIVREFGALIQSSSQEITQAIDQTRQFIREATKSANLLESIDTDPERKSKTINLEVTDIDEILKRSLASEKIEAMISGLIAKGLISAKDQKFQEALDALKIAREAAKNENLKEYTEIVDENIKQIENLDTETLDKQAIKYANEARDIVAKWEESKNNEKKDEPD